jgi:hypothetical protein
MRLSASKHAQTSTHKSKDWCYEHHPGSIVRFFTILEEPDVRQRGASLLRNMRLKSQHHKSKVWCLKVTQAKRLDFQKCEQFKVETSLIQRPELRAMHLEAMEIETRSFQMQIKLSQSIV